MNRRPLTTSFDALVAKRTSVPGVKISVESDGTVTVPLIRKGPCGCAFSIFVRVEIVQVFLLTVNAHPWMIHPADS